MHTGDSMDRTLGFLWKSSSVEWKASSFTVDSNREEAMTARTEAIETLGVSSRCLSVVFERPWR